MKHLALLLMLMIPFTTTPAWADLCYKKCGGGGAGGGAGDGALDTIQDQDAESTTGASATIQGANGFETDLLGDTLTIDKPGFEYNVTAASSALGGGVAVLDRFDLEAGIAACQEGFATPKTFNSRCKINMPSGVLQADVSGGNPIVIGGAAIGNSRNGITIEGDGGGPPQDTDGTTGSAASILEVCGDGATGDDIGVLIRGSWGLVLRDFTISGSCGTTVATDDVERVVEFDADNDTSVTNQFTYFDHMWIWGNWGTPSSSTENRCISIGSTTDPGDAQTDKIIFNQVWTDYCGVGFYNDSDQTVVMTMLGGQIAGEAAGITLNRGGLTLVGTTPICRDAGCAQLELDPDGQSGPAGTPNYLDMYSVYSELGASDFLRLGGGQADDGTPFTHVSMFGGRIRADCAPPCSNDLIDANGASMIHFDGVLINAAAGVHTLNVKIDGLVAPSNDSSLYFDVDWTDNGDIAWASSIDDTFVQAIHTNASGTFNDYAAGATTTNFNHTLDGDEDTIVTTDAADPLVIQVDTVSSAATAAQADADAAQADIDALFNAVQSVNDPSGACGYGAGENGLWTKTNATQTSSRFCWCSDPAADEWACADGLVP